MSSPRRSGEGRRYFPGQKRVNVLPSFSPAAYRDGACLAPESAAPLLESDRPVQHAQGHDILPEPVSRTGDCSHPQDTHLCSDTPARPGEEGEWTSWICPDIRRERSPGIRSSKERNTIDLARIREISTRYPFLSPAGCGGLKGMALLAIIRAARLAGEVPEYPAFRDICPQDRDRRISPVRTRIQGAIPLSGGCTGVSWGWFPPGTRGWSPGQVARGVPAIFALAQARTSCPICRRSRLRTALWHRRMAASMRPPSSESV